MTRSLPTAPADDLFSDDFITASDIAVRDARRNSGRKVVRVEAPAAGEPVACKRCGRRLSSPESVARGYGATCDRRMRNALADVGAAFKAHQIVSATELISDGGVVVGPGRTCIAVSSDGERTYVVDVTAGTCTCKAGEFGRRCFHLAAAIALTV